jgi:hypothetical protein
MAILFKKEAEQEQRQQARNVCYQNELDSLGVEPKQNKEPNEILLAHLSPFKFIEFVNQVSLITLQWFSPLFQILNYHTQSTDFHIGTGAERV